MRSGPATIYPIWAAGCSNERLSRKSAKTNRFGGVSQVTVPCMFQDIDWHHSTDRISSLAERARDYPQISSIIHYRHSATTTFWRLRLCPD